MFLLQVIAAFALAAAVLVSVVPAVVMPGRLATGPGVLARDLAALAGAGFALATLGGYLLSLRTGLFGFREVRTTPGIVAGVIDVVAFAVLAAVPVWAGSLRPWLQPGTGGAAPAGRIPAVLPASFLRQILPLVGLVSVVALVLLGADFAAAPGGAGTPAATAGQVLRAERVNGTMVLANDKGLTLYWFAPDTSQASHCTGTCAVYWPPVYGKPAAGAGVTGTFGTITRPDGTTQATYNGHPLYTYVGDTSPGQASGNNLDLNGGLWHDVPLPA